MHAEISAECVRRHSKLLQKWAHFGNSLVRITRAIIYLRLVKLDCAQAHWIASLNTTDRASKIAVALIDGPVALDHPDLSIANIHEWLVLQPEPAP